MVSFYFEKSIQNTVQSERFYKKTSNTFNNIHLYATFSFFELICYFNLNWSLFEHHKNEYLGLHSYENDNNK